MAAATFAEVWRSVRLSVPDAPAFLCRQWVQDAWNDLASRYGWGSLVLQGQLTFSASRTIAVTATLGSTTVTSAGLFVASDEGRTFSVGTYPLYQIQRFVDANTLELVLPYQGLSAGAVSGYIQDAYATLPIDFGRFVVVLDPINQRIVPWWATWEELGLLDPTRTSTAATPRLLASADMSPLTASLGQVQYRYWPKPSAAGALQYYATNAPAPLVDTDTFRGVFRQRPDVLREGALAKAARWPGTADRKNPYFNLGLAKAHQDEFDRKIIKLDLRDDDQFQQSWSTIPWQRWSTWQWAYNTRLLQASDATLADYAGYGGGGTIW